MSSNQLSGPLLCSVSRSFYLSIRLLPSRLRQPIGLAYLLARASDTIADSADTSAAERYEYLAKFFHTVQNGNLDGIIELQQAIRSTRASENQLIARLPECLSALTAIDPVERELIRAVLKKITTGQLYDILRFGDAEEIRALKTAGELEQYTYLVAGCVGEFWTDVCLHYYPWLSRLPTGEVREHSVNYGKALQLVNILRDLPEDLKQNRCYLPSEEIEPVVLIANPQQARPVFERWRKRAESLLDSGRKYTVSLRPLRIRAACYLPWEIGRRTLQLLAAQSPLETGERIKVSRAVVRTTLLRGCLAAFSNRPLAV